MIVFRVLFSVGAWLVEQLHPSLATGLPAYQFELITRTCTPWKLAYSFSSAMLTTDVIIFRNCNFFLTYVAHRPFSSHTLFRIAYIVCIPIPPLGPHIGFVGLYMKSRRWKPDDEYAACYFVWRHQHVERRSPGSRCLSLVHQLLVSWYNLPWLVVASFNGSLGCRNS
jgi:hypothetical protein